MNNKFKYLEDTYLFEDESTISSINSDERGLFVTFEYTIFHPQGGGQPSDTGIILKNGFAAIVESVAFVNGEIRHYIKSGDLSFRIGDKVTLKVDRNVRLQSAKCHTAGHLVQAVIESLPFGLQALKGYHFPNGAYVEFTGIMPENIERLIENANTLLGKIIQQGYQIETKMVNYEELKFISTYIPEGLPREKPLRVAIINGFSNVVPCGGTHLKNTSELGKVQINKVRSKKGNIRISYVFS